MCGIVFAHSRKGEAVNSWVRSQLQSQLSRGKQGFGTVLFNKGEKHSTNRSVEITDTICNLFFNEAEGILLHHRMPTSSENTLKQTHPIRVYDKEITDHVWLVAHNGIVSNRYQVRREHEEELGIKEYVTDEPKSSWSGKNSGTQWNDSECVAWEVAVCADSLLRGDDVDVMRTEGSQAFVAVAIDPETGEVKYVAYGRNEGNPLKIHTGGSALYLSSEGMGKNIEPNVMHITDVETHVTRRFKLRIPERQSTPVTTTSKPTIKTTPGGLGPSGKTDGTKEKQVKGFDYDTKQNTREIAKARQSQIDMIEELRSDNYGDLTRDDYYNRHVGGRYPVNDFEDEYDRALENACFLIQNTVDDLRAMAEYGELEDYDQIREDLQGELMEVMDELFEKAQKEYLESCTVEGTA